MKVKKAVKRRSAAATAWQCPVFRKRVVKSTKAYSRKARPARKARKAKRHDRTALDRPFRPAHHLFARLGHRPLRFSLRLLHGRDDDTSCRARICSRLEEIDRLASAFIAKRRAQSAAHRRRAAGAQEHHVADRALSRHLGARPRRADADHQWQASLRSYAEALAACGVARINVSLDTLDPAKFRDDHPLGRLRAGAARHRRGRRAPASRSRSTPSRCAASTRTRSRT